MNWTLTEELNARTLNAFYTRFPGQIGLMYFFHELANEEDRTIMSDDIPETRVAEYGRRVPGEWEKQLIKLEHLGDESYVALLPNGDKHVFVAADHKLAGDVVRSEHMSSVNEFKVRKGRL